MASKPVHRLTLFKIPEDEDQKAVLTKYRTLKQDAIKDGKPYIVSVDAGKAMPDQRTQGYTLGVKTVFASKVDMDYFDTDCSAHKASKAVSSKVADGVIVVYFESIFDEAEAKL
ncbi:MAG: hypothetical protein M1827_003187 [Pycnora praestabilis]|nr:MAG: hypothetical protein M1827_003187 [Pycnora praestabilis]